MQKRDSFDDARKSNSRSGISDFDFEELISIAGLYFTASGLLMTLVDFAGKLTQAALNQLPDDWSDKLNQLGEQALTVAYDMAVWTSVERADWLEKVLAWARSDRFHQLGATVMEAIGGLGGSAGTLVELPITTTLILRSIQEIAKSHGEDPANPAIRQQCLQVLALMGPREDDDDLEKGFFSARLAINASTISQLIRTVAARFNVVLADKFLASAAPVLGAGAGAVVNHAFISYFQTMAHVHFRLRKIENSNDPDQVKSCFERIVLALRQQRKVDRGGKRHAQQ